MSLPAVRPGGVAGTARACTETAGSKLSPLSLCEQQPRNALAADYVKKNVSQQIDAGLGAPPPDPNAGRGAQPIRLTRLAIAPYDGISSA